MQSLNAAIFKPEYFPGHKVSGLIYLFNEYTVFPRLERACSINFRLAPRGVVFEGAL